MSKFILSPDDIELARLEVPMMRDLLERARHTRDKEEWIALGNQLGKLCEDWRYFLAKMYVFRDASYCKEEAERNIYALEMGHHYRQHGEIRDSKYYV